MVDDPTTTHHGQTRKNSKGHKPQRVKLKELFNLKMLTENIVHDCVFKPLKAKDEESVECVCRLLSIIGKELDTDKARVRISHCK